MIKPKNLIVASVALAAVVGVVVVSENLTNKRPAAKSLKFFPTLSTSNISALLIADAADTVKLSRKGDTWFVGRPDGKSAMKALPISTSDGSASSAGAQPYPADSATVQAALEKIESMKKDVLVSENKDKQDVFEVDSVKGLFVEVWDDKGNSVGAFRIGKNGPDWSSHYVRMLGSNAVYSVGGSIRYAFFSDQKRWRDRSMIKFDKSLAQSLSVVKSGGFSLTIEKGKDSTGEIWSMTIPEKARAKKDEVVSLIDELSRLSCADWQEDTSSGRAAMGLTPPQMTIAVTMQNGNRHVVNIGEKSPTNQYWASVDGKEPIFLVPDHIVGRFDLTVDKIKEVEATVPNS